MKRYKVWISPDTTGRNRRTSTNRTDPARSCHEKVPVGGVAPRCSFRGGCCPNARQRRRVPARAPDLEPVFVLFAPNLAPPMSLRGASPHDVASVGGAALPVASGGEFRQHLAPTLPPLGEFQTPARRTSSPRSHRSSVDVARRECSAVDIARRECSAVDIARHECSAVDIARRECSAVDVARCECSPVDVAWPCCSAVDVPWLCCSAVDVTRLCCSAVDVARRLRSAVDVAPAFSYYFLFVVHLFLISINPCLLSISALGLLLHAMDTGNVTTVQYCKRTYLIFNNDKPWFTAKLRYLRQAKEDAFRNGDRVLYNQARNTLNKEIRVAKRSYAKKLENQFSSNDPASVWKGLKDITNYKTPSPSTEANQQLAEDLNEFYCRFETAGLTPHAPSENLSTQPLTSQQPPPPPPALWISEDDVCQIFLKQKRRKAPGPDGVTPACLKTCADQLAFIFSQIFNGSLELCEVPACFKHSTIIPIPKKPKITGLNDYRPVALTSEVMKSFERLVLAYLKNITGP
ncbi:hypothetical protein QTP86_007390 [Hemibagrus guttatus]|nr:hypothetical protein QTP86_007390 [Hemibagrus guttatus]